VTAESAGVLAGSRRLVSAAVVVVPGFEALVDGDGGEAEADERVGPPPAEGGVERQPD